MGCPRIDFIGPGIFFSGPEKPLSKQERRWNMMKQWFLRLLVCVVLATPGFGWAEEEENTKAGVSMLEEIVVTATRKEESVRKVPSNVTVIEAQVIRDSGATSILDLLEHRANVHVKTYTGNASQAMIDLRGFGGDHPYRNTLILLDGRRMNRPDMASVNWLQIPLQLIERIEVVRGTNTALYGDSATAGVINIITKKGTAEPKIDFSAIVGENRAHVERAGIVGAQGKLSYAVNGENQANDGWRDRSGFRSKGGGFRFGYDFSDTFSVSAGGSYNKSDFEMPGNLTKEEMALSRTQSQPARTWYPPAWGGWPATTGAHTDNEGRNEYFNGNILFKGSFERIGEMEVNFLFGRKDIATDMPTGWVPGQYNQFDIDTFGATPKYILDKSFLGFGNKLIAGFDIYHETLVLNQFLDKDRLIKAWDAKLAKDSLGWYLRDEFSLLENLILGLGYRYEKAKFEGKKTQFSGGGFGAAFGPEDKTHREDAFDIGLTWLFGERSKFYGKYSTTYRYPFTDEHVNYHGLNDGFNTDLNPEKGKSYEIGGSYSPVERMNLGITLYQIDMKDEITWDIAQNMNVNLDETSHRGVEVSLSYRVKDFINFYGNYSLHEAEFEKGQFKGKQLPFVPTHLISAGLDLTLPYHIHLCPDMLYVSSSYLGNDFDNSSEKLSGYSVYNLYVRFLPKWKAWKFMAFIGAKNIFNKKYETWGFENDPNDGGAPANTYYPASGREFLGGVSFQY
jgi:iron complex outermembrane receptor protein